MLAQQRGEPVVVEEVRAGELDAVADRRQVRVLGRRVADEADDLVPAVEQELGEIRAVLAGGAGDDRAAQFNPRTYAQPSLSPSERIERTISA